ncbi:MAG: hypothetical protein ACRDA4_05855 [Filifactoraceae bacterium]
MRYFGKCPAACGEIFQGYMGEDEFLVSYFIPLYSRAELVEGSKNISPFENSRVKILDRKNKKVELAKNKTLEYFGVPQREIEDIKIEIKSSIPIGKGLSSSTADIGATIAACGAYLGKIIDSELATKIALSIEATDTNYFRKSMVFSSVTGERRETLGVIENSKVLVLIPEGRVNTQELRMRDNYIQIKKRNEEGIRRCYENTVKSFRDKNYARLGEVGIESALMNESLIKKMYLNEIIEIALVNNTYGVNIAHSGTAIGILMRNDYDETKLIYELRESGILNFYNTSFTMPIIEGGLSQEVD